MRYLKSRDGFPDPRSSLSLTIPSQAIARVNQEVQEAMNSKEGNQCGSYERYSSDEHAEILKPVKKILRMNPTMKI